MDGLDSRLALNTARPSTGPRLAANTPAPLHELYLRLRCRFSTYRIRAAKAHDITATKYEGGSARH